MKATARFVFNRKHTATATHTAAVQIEVYHAGKRKWLPTGVKLTKDQWYNKRGILVTNRADASTISEGLMQQLEHIERILLRAGDDFMWSMLDNASETNSFLDFVKDRISHNKEIGDSTRRQHMSFYRILCEYGKIVRFSDITEYNIRNYNEWLLAKGIGQSTVANHHKRMKIYIHKAMLEKLVDQDPYLSIKIPRGGKNLRKYLTDDEMEAMTNVEIRNDSLAKTRDLFVFQAYTGLAYADVAKLTKKDFIKRDGKLFLLDARTKTGEAFYLQMLPPALKILKKYDYELPIISNQKYNLNLKDVARIADIHKNLTSHMARHTFAVWVLNNNIPIESVQRMLGHSNIKTTQIYAKIVQKSLDTAFDHLASLTPDI